MSFPGMQFYGQAVDAPATSVPGSAGGLRGAVSYSASADVTSTVILWAFVTLAAFALLHSEYGR